MIPPGYEAVSLVEALNGVSCLPGPGRASSRSVRSSGRGGARGPEAPSPSNGLGLGVQPPQRSASALTAGSYGTGTETYATIGPGASIINGLPYKEVPERGGRESVNTAAATGTGSIVSSIAASARACHRATTDLHDVEYYPEDQQTRSGSPAVSQFTEPIFPGDESTHAGNCTKSYIRMIYEFSEAICITTSRPHKIKYLLI